jgi:hypothetical protein
MPWQALQLERMICRTGPSGKVTSGRDGRRLARSWANAGKASARLSAATTGNAPGAAENQTERGISGDFQEIGALADAVTLHVEQVQDTQEKIGAAFRVIGEYEMAIALEAAVDAADENRRDLLVRVPM